MFSNNNIFRSIMLIKKYYFYKLLEKNFAHLTSIKAKYALEFKVGPIIAKNINYTNKIIIFFVVFIATLIYLPVLFHVAHNISYCLQNILKSLLFIRTVRELPLVRLHGSFDVIPVKDCLGGYQSRHCERLKGAWQYIKMIKKCYAFFTGLLRQNFQFFLAMTTKPIHATMPYIDDKANSIQDYQAKPKISQNEEKALPVYTVLVPLYKELSKLRSIIKNISLINYPKDKLDVKIIIEDDDSLMIKEVALYNLPSYFHVILVPKSLPRTKKPKALNYALEYSRGEYLVVYDAVKINLNLNSYLKL
ncbi:glycosyltransferase [Rickettsia helvetica]|nr:glycosyltransferase [Rickettsia helvetica]